MCPKRYIHVLSNTKPTNDEFCLGDPGMASQSKRHFSQTQKYRKELVR